LCKDTRSSRWFAKVIIAETCEDVVGCQVRSPGDCANSAIVDVDILVKGVYYNRKATQLANRNNNFRSTIVIIMFTGPLGNTNNRDPCAQCKYVRFRMQFASWRTSAHALPTTHPGGRAHARPTHERLQRHAMPVPPRSTTAFPVRAGTGVLSLIVEIHGL